MVKKDYIQVTLKSKILLIKSQLPSKTGPTNKRGAFYCAEQFGWFQECKFEGKRLGRVEFLCVIREKNLEMGTIGKRGSYRW